LPRSPGDHGAAFRKVVDALGFPPERIVIEAPVVASRQADLLSFVLRNYRHHGFRVAVNVESVAQWRALSSIVPAEFIKIDATAVSLDRGAATELDHLRALAGTAAVIVKRVEAVPAKPWPQGVLVQGFAYGAPFARPVLRSPVRIEARREPQDVAIAASDAGGATSRS